jgi:pSer/pThr/pTyr-binding forkhead associated (FHA) protein
MPTIPGYTSNPGPALPADAPRIRATAGAGTAGQKTWSLRRPVTVVGSGRGATIVVNQPQADKAHCAIVNTGDCVVLRDLHTASGTMRNGQRVDVAVLADGDVIEVAGVRIQIAIQSPRRRNEQTGVDLSFVDPMQWPVPFVFRADGESDDAAVEAPFCVIGRRERAAIRLDDPEVSLAHAIVFRFNGRPAICDLGSRTGTRVNGRPVTFAPLRDGDELRIGPAAWRVEDRSDSGRSERQLSVASGNVARRAAELEEWERRLKAREAAIDAREQELRRVEDSLRRREQLLRAGADSATQPPEPPNGIRFTGLADSYQHGARIAVPPPPEVGS